MNAPAGAPLITDVTFRLSQEGDMVGMDFECGDGRTRSVMLPVSTLPKLIAGMMWAGAESAERRPGAPVSPTDREMMQDGARVVTDWRVMPADDRRDALLELESGASRLCVRVPGTDAMLLGLALQRAAGDLQ